VPDAPAAGAEWTLTLLIDHPSPEEVTVLAPPVTAALFLDQVRKGPYAAGPPADSGRPWTAVEYRFTVRRSGAFTLDSFTVIVPGGRTITAPLVLNARMADGEAESSRPRLAWESPPSNLRAGKPAAIELRAGGAGFRQPLPEPELFMPAVPAGFIIAPERLSPEERSGGLALRLTVIPLDAAALALPGRAVQYGNTVFEIPGLHIPVIPAGLTAGEADAPAPERPAPDAELAPAPNVPAAPFPDFESPSRPYPILRRFFGGPYAAVYDAARDLWDRGYRAEALAELRRGERDHPAGPLFASLRREAEASLGLTGTGDEESAYPMLALCAVCFALVLAAGPVCRALPRPARRNKIRALCLALYAAGALFALYRLLGGSGKLPGQARTGVLRASAVHRIPDPEGEVIARFREGRPVRLPPAAGKTGRWVRIITRDRDNDTGWVPVEQIILY
jgi:hypothetical protein